MSLVSGRTNFFVLTGATSRSSLPREFLNLEESPDPPETPRRRKLQHRIRRPGVAHSLIRVETLAACATPSVNDPFISETRHGDPNGIAKRARAINIPRSRTLLYFRAARSCGRHAIAYTQRHTQNMQSGKRPPARERARSRGRWCGTVWCGVARCGGSLHDTRGDGICSAAMKSDTGALYRLFKPCAGPSVYLPRSHTHSLSLSISPVDPVRALMR